MARWLSLFSSLLLFVACTEAPDTKLIDKVKTVRIPSGKTVGQAVKQFYTIKAKRSPSSITWKAHKLDDSRYEISVGSGEKVDFVWKMTKVSVPQDRIEKWSIKAQSQQAKKMFRRQ